MNGSELIKGQKYYTDYPFTELGDTQYTKSPVRQITFLKYDGDKYCDIKFGDKELSVKSAYIYNTPQRMVLGKMVDVENFETDSTV